MPDFIAQAGEGWPSDPDGDAGHVLDYDPRTPKQRHDDHYNRLVANSPDRERWVVIDERQMSVSGVHPGKRYEIARCHGSVSNSNDDGTPSAMSLTRAEFGKPWVREYVRVERLHATQEAAAEFLRAMHACAVADMEERIEGLRTEMRDLDDSIGAALQASRQTQQAVAEGAGEVVREALRSAVEALRTWKLGYPDLWDALDERAVTLLTAALATKEQRS